MFKPLRVLPVLVVLAAILMAAKTAGLGVALKAAIEGESGIALAAAEPTPRLEMALPVDDMTGPPLETAAGDGAGDLPEMMTGALSGTESAGSAGAGVESMLEPAAAEAGEAGGEEEMGAGTENEAMAMPGEVRDPLDISDEELELLQRLAERREMLAARAENLDQRESLLAATEARIADKMTELKALQALIESLLVKHDEQEEARMQSLVKIYESMKPKDAARIFGELDMVVLLDVIGRMKERKSATILAKMDPERAKEVTLELAQRRELPVARQ